MQLKRSMVDHALCGNPLSIEARDDSSKSVIRLTLKNLRSRESVRACVCECMSVYVRVPRQACPLTVERVEFSVLLFRA